VYLAREDEFPEVSKTLRDLVSSAEYLAGITGGGTSQAEGAVAKSRQTTCLRCGQSTPSATAHNAANCKQVYSKAGEPLLMANSMKMYAAGKADNDGSSRYRRNSPARRW
jgi:hypothetical protein